jgi:hypothetical protein
MAGGVETLLCVCVLTFILFDFFLNPPTQFLFIAAVVIILYGLRPLFISLRPRASEEERRKERKRTFYIIPSAVISAYLSGQKRASRRIYTRATALV